MTPNPGTIPILFYGAMRKKFGKRRDLAGQGFRGCCPRQRRHTGRGWQRLAVGSGHRAVI